MSLDCDAVSGFVETFWEDDILPSLAEYIRIPAKSPGFDKQWAEHGYLQQAVDHITAWIEQLQVDGLHVSVHHLPGKTPTILMEYPGTLDDTILIYGHLDKQPEFSGWEAGLSPWEPVRRDDKLYGRGGADDGYAAYAAVAVIKCLIAQGAPLPRIVTLIEASEESGSPDLPDYMQALADRIGSPSLVIALDSTCGNYEQLWITTSLRGLVAGKLEVRVLEEGAHSGAAGGIVGSSFRIMRQLISRVEDENTGQILPSFLNEQIPEPRRIEAIAAGRVLEHEFTTLFTYAGESGPMTSDPTELVLNNTWMSSLEITGIDGVPDIENAGNVLRPYTTAKLSLRLPPTTDAAFAGEEVKRLLESARPNGVHVAFHLENTATGWHAPITAPALESAMQDASNEFFGAPAIYTGCGGTIPFMQALAESQPRAQFVVTGLLGPRSNAHGPNEFLHIPYAKKLTAAVASIVHDWAARPAD
ncbi:MAG: M20/M25/M40 family metallo-hydrolase [Pseudomonadales bacterium]